MTSLFTINNIYLGGRNSLWCSDDRKYEGTNQTGIRWSFGHCCWCCAKESCWCCNEGPYWSVWILLISIIAQPYNHPLSSMSLPIGNPWWGIVKASLKQTALRWVHLLQRHAPSWSNKTRSNRETVWGCRKAETSESRTRIRYYWDTQWWSQTSPRNFADTADPSLWRIGNCGRHW